MELPKVNTEECIACEACIEICPFAVIKIVDGKAKIDHKTCSNCRICTMACPVGAIQ